jgi:predicted nucleic acid-binding protein
LAVRQWLVDTGPFVAYLDRTETAHAAVTDLLDDFAGQLITTGAVVTEVMYFVSDHADGPASFAALLLDADVQVVEASQPEDVLGAAALMKKYSDTPMDYADATLVAAADHLAVVEILTLDRRGFSTYRTPKGKRFRLVLDRR